MKQLLSLLVGGQSLRHLPVALRREEQAPVRAVARVHGEERDVTARIYPVSLRPLLLGLARIPGEPPPGPTEIEMRDVQSATALGMLRLEPAGTVTAPGTIIDLMRPTRSSVRCVPWSDRAWRYMLAWRQVRFNLRRPHAFQMSFADLRALNVFYMMPRPVYLVSVVAEGAGNIFPMDLVGPWGSGAFLMALRLTSPSVETMRAAGRIAVSGVPAELKDAAYQVAGHHKERSIDWAALPFPVEPSPTFGFPVPAAALGVRELQVRHSEPIGSHMFFVTSAISETVKSDAPQLCHVSDMYARWRAAHDRAFVSA